MIKAYFSSMRNFDAIRRVLTPNTISFVPLQPPTGLTSLLTKGSGSISVLAAAAGVVPDIEKIASLDAPSTTGSKGSQDSDMELLGSIAPVIFVSTDSSIPYLSEDNPDWHIFHDVPIEDSVAGAESEDEEFVNLPPPPKKTKKSYELTRKFQMDWSAKAPWSEMILTADGILHMVKCIICSTVKGRPMIMAPKWDTIRRHSKRICHLKNTKLYATRRPTTVL
jgi:hypothetical protein